MNPPNTQQLAIPSRHEMFTALDDRDSAFDGVFFYGVITTGIFCRPSCPSRPARRDNVRFFVSAEEASLSGFRPCKRCRPDTLDADTEKVVGIARHIEAHADEKLTLATLANVAGLSSSRLQRAFKAAFGISPKQYQDAVRLGRLKDALQQGDDVTGAIYSAGFGSASRVYGEASRNLGMTPAAYRAGGEGEQIWYAYRDSALGPLLMAATARGVCFAQFGDSESSLVSQLRAEFPQARIERSPGETGPELDAWILALDDHVSRNAPRPDLPLDLRGTAFQLRVWRFLLGIDDGDVVSYGEVATGIGRPNAVRAAASACGANRVGVLVPCHRVLRGNGDLGGYRWGVDRKRALLDLERRLKALSE
jgi:AraC family transcriptional regulator of adaptative response/methylated-DNA-[protein]-cysteine methyltransferase